MSWCVSIYGIIQYKKVPNELPFKELKTFDESAKGKIKDNVINFTGYCRYTIIEYFQKYIKDNIKNIEMSHIHFSSSYEEEYDVIIETVDDEYYEESVKHHIGPEWFSLMHLDDTADELNDTSKIIIKEREIVNQQSTPNINNKKEIRNNGNNDDSELPF